MLNIQIKKIKSDFSNIDEIYNNSLKSWQLSINQNNNIELTEFDYINTQLTDICNIDFNTITDIEKKQFEFLSLYLSKKRLKIEWNLNDYYKHYLETKRFGFIFLKTYKKEDFEDFKETLNNHKKTFDYIFIRLTSEDKTELICDYKDQLQALKTKQTQTKYIELIENLIKQINIDAKTEDLIKKYNYNPTTLKSLLNFKNEDGTKNQYYYIHIFNEYKNSLNSKLDIYNFDAEFLPIIRNFNLGIEYLLNEIIKHYKNVENYKFSKLESFDAYNYRDSLNFTDNLSFIKSYSTKLIDLKIQNKDINQLRKIQTYCINIFLSSLETLKNNFEIDVYKSPLKSNFLEIEKALIKVINIIILVYA